MIKNIIKRDGTTSAFDLNKIEVAIQKAYVDVYKDETGQRMKDVVASLTAAVNTALSRDQERTHVHVEDVQDQVELAMMRQGEHDLARSYIIYRAKHAEQRAAKEEAAQPIKSGKRVVIRGVEQTFDVQALIESLKTECTGLDADVESIALRAEREIFEGADEHVIEKAVLLATKTLIETDPVYDRVYARLSFGRLYEEVLGRHVPLEGRAQATRDLFPTLILIGINYGLFNERLLTDYDLPRLAAALDFSRDGQFTTVGIQTLYDRYFVHVDERRIETAQTFFMRVAMGLAFNEDDRNARAIEFYNVLSSFDFMNSTPTLFNSGLVNSQLASCFLTTIDDSLESIYRDGISQNAFLQKFSGGLGNDWSNVRALGSLIKGTNGKSQGVIPFLKVSNDTAVAVNQGGKRQGAVCAYLETWHLDIEDFLELRKNTGDDRRRTHDMNTANWIPDLFMQRVMTDGTWTLFSPSDTPDLHDLYGLAFAERYQYYEAHAAAGLIKLHKTVQAKDLWRKMLTMLFETGHPWITFKDACNLRSPQQHVGVVHSSNLCTEITLNTSSEETAVCNIGSVNLVNHLVNGKLDRVKLRKTVHTAMRMLDNVIDLTIYTVEKARRSNQRHRPVGIGMMGFHDCLQEQHVAYGSEEAMRFADESAELLSYYAYEASSELARERGTYGSYKGSLWDQGILPWDSAKILAETRGAYSVQVLETHDHHYMTQLERDALRERIREHGMRNSNCVAVAPTATIANIVGVSAGNDPNFANLSVKSNMSGEFTLLNERLVRDLKKTGQWDAAMLADLKHYKGSVQQIERVSAELKAIYATAFEIGSEWYVEAAARRQKSIDQAQSLNLYMTNATGPKLDKLYKFAWLRGLKTTYYLRTLGATHAESSTGRAGTLNAVAAVSTIAPVEMPEPEGAVCTMRPGDPGFEDCEACQ